jgi:hypothetical protein
VIVVGAGTGGTAAAIQAARLGAKVALVEPTQWLGGQATSAAVGSMDESVAGERSFGLYQELYDGVLAYYQARGKPVGTCYWSSATHCFEPHVGHQVLQALVADAGVRVFYGTGVAGVAMQGGAVGGVVVTDGRTLTSRVVIEATEYGDVLPFAGARYHSGNAKSGALDAGACVQDITYVAVVKRYPGGLPSGLLLPTKPPNYDAEAPYFARIVTRDGGSWYAAPGVYPVDVASHHAYRGLPDGTGAGAPSAGTYAGAAALTKTSLNYANDWPAPAAYNPPPGPAPRLSSRILESPVERAAQECEAKLRTLNFIYYLQNELGASDWSVADDEGWAAQFTQGCSNIPAAFKPVERHFPPIPYVREGRRAFGRYTLTGSDLGGRDDGGTPKLFVSSVGVAGYGDDLHNCNTTDTLEAPETRADITHAGRFQVPFEVFIPETVQGLVLAEKNLSQTRLVNGATRLQPSTMLLGQAAGAIAALAAKKGVQPSALAPVLAQDALVRANVQIAWQVYSDVPPADAVWGDVQLTATHGVLVGYGNGLFGKSDPLTRAQAAVMTAKLFSLDTSTPPLAASFTDVPVGHFAYASVEALKDAGYTSGCGANVFCPDAPFTRVQLAVFEAKGLSLDLAAQPLVQRYSDVPASDPALRAIHACVDAQVLAACDAGVFCRDRTVTRGEAAGAVRRTLLYGK